MYSAQHHITRNLPADFSELKRPGLPEYSPVLLDLTALIAVAPERGYTASPDYREFLGRTEKVVSWIMNIVSEQQRVRGCVACEVNSCDPIMKIGNLYGFGFKKTSASTECMLMEYDKAFIFRDPAAQQMGDIVERKGPPVYTYGVGKDKTWEIGSQSPVYISNRSGGAIVEIAMQFAKRGTFLNPRIVKECVLRMRGFSSLDETTCYQFNAGTGRVSIDHYEAKTLSAERSASPEDVNNFNNYFGKLSGWFDTLWENSCRGK